MNHVVNSECLTSLGFSTVTYKMGLIIYGVVKTVNVS